MNFIVIGALRVSFRSVLLVSFRSGFIVLISIIFYVVSLKQDSCFNFGSNFLV